MNDMRIILITGKPGVGKTTLVKRICEQLQNCNGFYTEEVRDVNSSKRIGFDIVTVPHCERGILARSTGSSTSMQSKRPRVGNYSVFIDEFELLALKVIQQQLEPPHDTNNSQILVIDEIGKMELKSFKFVEIMQSLLSKMTTSSKNPLFLLATIPLQQQQHGMSIVEQITKSPNSTLFHLTVNNRKQIYNDILRLLQEN